MKFNTKTFCLSLLLVNCAVIEAAQVKVVNKKQTVVPSNKNQDIQAASAHIMDDVLDNDTLTHAVKVNRIIAQDVEAVHVPVEGIFASGAKNGKIKLTNKRECADDDISIKEGEFINAVRAGKLKCAKELLAQKEVDINNCFQDDLLFELTSQGELEKLKFMMENGVDPTFVNQDSDLDPLLIIAIEYGHEHVVKYLVEGLEFNVNYKSEECSTPLDEAISRGRVSIVEYLLEKGARIGLNHGEFLLKLAEIQTSRTAFDTVIDPMSFAMIVMAVLKKGEAESNAKSTLEAINLDNRTIDRRRVECVENTPLTHLDLLYMELLRNIQKYPRTVVKFIESGHFSVNACYEYSPLAMLVREGSLDGVKLLLSKGADPAFVGWNHSQSPLIFEAAMHNRKEIINFLVDQLKFSLEHRNKNGNTALMEAALRGNKLAVGALLGKGAKLDPMNNENRTSIDLARDLANQKGTREYSEILHSLNEKKKSERSIDDPRINLTNKIAENKLKDFRDHVHEYNRFGTNEINNSIVKAIGILGVRRVKAFYDEILKNYSSKVECIKFLCKIREAINLHLQNHPWEDVASIKNVPVVRQPETVFPKFASWRK